MNVQTITRTEYDAKMCRKVPFAGQIGILRGTTVERWQRETAGWDGLYWHTTHDGGPHAVLAPVNVIEDDHSPRPWL